MVSFIYIYISVKISNLISGRNNMRMSGVFVKYAMTPEDPKVKPTLPRRATIVHDDPTKVKSLFKQLHHMN